MQGNTAAAAAADTATENSGKLAL